MQRYRAKKSFNWLSFSLDSGQVLTVEEEGKFLKVCVLGSNTCQIVHPRALELNVKAALADGRLAED